MENLTPTIEAVLFHAGRQVSLDELSNLAGGSEERVKESLRELQEVLSDGARGLKLLWNANGVLMTIKGVYQDALNHLTSVSSDTNSLILDEYLSARRQAGLRDSTLNAYKMFLTRFLKDVRKPLDQYTTRDIRLFLLNEERERGNGHSTIAGKIHSLSAFFKWLLREEYVEKDPMLRIDAPKLNDPYPKYLSQEELEKVRRACKKPVERLIVEVLYATGIRRAELVALDWEDIHLEEKYLVVKDGKGGGERIAPLSTLAVMLLKEHKSKSNPDHIWVLESQWKRRMSKHNINRLIGIIGDRAGLKDRLTPHRLRHTLGTHLLAADVPIDVVQKILGHRSVKTTQVYARTQRDKIMHHYRRLLA